MSHRDDGAAKDARIEALERELADAQADAARAREEAQLAEETARPRERPPPSSASPDARSRPEPSRARFLQITMVSYALIYGASAALYIAVSNAIVDESWRWLGIFGSWLTTTIVSGLTSRATGVDFGGPVGIALGLGIVPVFALLGASTRAPYEWLLGGVALEVTRLAIVAVATLGSAWTFARLGAYVSFPDRGGETT